MKKLVLFIELIVLGVLPGYSLKMQDVLYVGDLEKAHYMTVADIIKNDLLKKYSSWYSIPYNGKEVFVSEPQMAGVVRNDIDLFCQNTPLAYKSELEREFEPELYDSLKVLLRDLREEIKVNKPHYSISKSSLQISDYDLSKKGFNVSMLDIFGYPSQHEKSPSQFSAWLDDDLIKELVKVKTVKITERWSRTDEYLEFFMEVKNKRVALEVQKELGDFSPNGKVDLVYEFSIIDEEDKTYFLVTDIYLLYLPTQDIIWSAKRGDLSEEITLE